MTAPNVKPSFLVSVEADATADETAAEAEDCTAEDSAGAEDAGAAAGAHAARDKTIIKANASVIILFIFLLPFITIFILPFRQK
jgi:hypothetical protein